MRFGEIHLITIRKEVIFYLIPFLIAFQDRFYKIDKWRNGRNLDWPVIITSLTRLTHFSPSLCLQIMRR